MYTYPEIRTLVAGSTSIYVEFQISNGHYIHVVVDGKHLLQQLKITSENWIQNKPEDMGDELFEARVDGTTLYVGVCQ